MAVNRAMNSKALQLAANYAWDDVHGDGHWYGEMKTNATITAEYVMLYQALGLENNLSATAKPSPTGYYQIRTLMDHGESHLVISATSLLLRKPTSL